MFGRKSLLALISFAIIKLINGLVFLYAVNVFLPIQFGFFQVATSIMVIFSLVATFGTSEAHLLIMADTNQQNDAFSIFFIIKIVLIVLSSIVTLLIVFFQIQLSAILHSNEQLWILFLVFLNTLLLTIGNIYMLSFKGRLEIARSEFPLLIGAFMGAIFSFISILVFNNFLLYLVGTTVSYMINLILYFWLGRNYSIKSIDKKLLRRYISLGLIFLAPVIFYRLRMSLGPIIFLNYFDENLLGIYSVLSFFFLMIVAAEMSFSKLLLPNFRKQLSENKHTEIKMSIEVFSRYVTILNGVLIIVGIIFGEYILKYVFGLIYHQQGLYFYYGFLLYLLPFSLYVPYSNFIISANKMKAYYLIEGILLLFSLVSWFVFIPLFDIIGIEVGGWIAILLNLLILRIYCTKKFEIGKLRLKESIHYIVLLLLFVLSFFLAFKQLQLWVLIVVFISIISGYVLYLFLAKILTKKDMKYILDVVNPKKMADYIKTEIKE